MIKKVLDFKKLDSQNDAFCNWIDKLVELITKLGEATKDNYDFSYFNSFYKYQSHSGGDTVTGYILNLFLYLNEDGKIKYKKDMNYQRTFNGEVIPKATLGNFIDTACCVPFTYISDKEYKLTFNSGLLHTLEEGVVKAVIYNAVGCQ